MKAIGIIVISVFFAFVNAGDIYYDLSDAPILFHKFIKKYNRSYKDTPDILEHYAAFITNLKKINKQNMDNPLATFDINKFADYTEEESQLLYGFLTPNARVHGWGRVRGQSRNRSQDRSRIQ